MKFFDDNKISLALVSVFERKKIKNAGTATTASTIVECLSFPLWT